MTKSDSEKQNTKKILSRAKIGQCPNFYPLPVQAIDFMNICSYNKKCNEQMFVN